MTMCKLARIAPECLTRWHSLTLRSLLYQIRQHPRNAKP